MHGRIRHEIQDLRDFSASAPIFVLKSDFAKSDNYQLTVTSLPFRFYYLSIIVITPRVRVFLVCGHVAPHLNLPPRRGAPPSTACDGDSPNQIYRATDNEYQIEIITRIKSPIRWRPCHDTLSSPFLFGFAS